MRREEVERRLLTERLEAGYLFPDYEDYCFANVPETALSVLDGSFDRRLPANVFDGVETDVDHVVVFLLDGFGYEHWKREHRDHALLSRLTDRGRVTPLTSIYPSETAAAITTLHTGQSPIEHGLLGWYQYLDGVGEDAITLPFTTVDGEPLADAAPAAEPQDLFEGSPLYERAVEAGIDVHALLPAGLVDSGYSRAVTAGADRTGYDASSELARTIRETLTDAAGPTFVHAYEPTIDAVAHAEGTESDRYRAELGRITDELRDELVDRLGADVAARTLLVFTADHGFVDTVPDENVALSESSVWPALTETLKRDGDGDRRLPTGSPRNTHFHVRQDRIEDARSLLEDSVDGLVFTREEALDRDLFGVGSPSALFERRCGDLVAIHRNRGLCWRDQDCQLIGMHGGLTREEMLVPFAAARLDRLG